MTPKPLLWFFILLFSSVGSWIPTLWNTDLFSSWSIFGSAVGAFFGLYVGYKVGQQFL
jgi:hypothetical protein